MNGRQTLHNAPTVGSPNSIRLGRTWSILLVFALLLRFCGDAEAEPNKAVTVDALKKLSEQTFSSLGVKQGMPHDSTFAVTQDDQGFLWIGTFGGLARFDGYEFHVYRHDEGALGTLPDNTVRALQRRSEGGIWIGTGTAGLAIYDPATDKFRVPENEPDELRRAHIFAIEDDHEGGVWIAHSSGLSHYSALTHTFENLRSELRSEGQRREEIFAVQVLASGDVLAGGHGLFLRRKGGDIWESLPFGASPDDIGAKQAVWSIFQSHDGEVWIGTDVNGLGHLDKAEMTVHGVPHLSGRDNLFGQNTVRSFAEPSPGEMWIGSYGGGLIQLDRRTAKTHVWKHDPTATGPLSNNFIRSTLLDRRGILWIATNAGLSFTNVQPLPIFTIFSSPLRPGGLFGMEVRSVGAVAGRVLVGFDDGGIAVIEPDGAVRKLHPAAGRRKDQMSGREVMTIRAVDDKTAVAGGGGLFLLDLPSLTYRKIDLPQLQNEVLKNIAVNGRDLWLGTYAGLVRYNLDTGKVQSFQHRPGDPTSLIDNYVLDLLVRPDGRLWIGTRLGLELLDPQTGIFLHFSHVDGAPASLANSNVQTLAFDVLGRLWAGTVSGGVSILENDDEIKPAFRTLKLNSSKTSPVILSLALGLDGRMWINTPIGLINTDSSGGDVEVYGPEDGLQDNGQNLYGSARLHDGTILFPGHANLTVAQPQRIPAHRLQGPLVLTNLEIPGDSRSSTALARNALANGIHIDSHHGFDASFADLDYGAVADVQYSYQLEGFDTDWKNLALGQRTAVYTNLPPGDYRLLLRASHEGKDDSVQIAIPVEVKPRIYERGWFRGLISGLLLLAILLAVRLRTAAMTRHRHSLEEKIAQRTSDLLEREAQLKEANTKLADLATHDFLTGLLNRRGFLSHVETEITRCRLAGAPFCTLIVDLDHFKQLNDNYGHEVGDRALQFVARALQSSLRDTDLLGRWGGEEFILFLPCTSEPIALLLAERLRGLIQGLHVEIEENRIQLTASVGLAVSGPSYSFEDVLAQADRHLYRAKRAGRNCVQGTEN